MSSQTIASPPGPLIYSSRLVTALHVVKPYVFTKSTVTQLTSVTTAVTLNSASGTVRTFASSLAADTAQGAFTVNNSYIAADSVVVVQINGLVSGTAALPTLYVTAVAEGSFTVVVMNNDADGAFADAIFDISFLVL